MSKQTLHLSQKKEQSGITTPDVVVTEADRVEPVTANVDLKTLFDEEAEAKKFMDEIVIVRIHKTTDKNLASHVILSVNGKTQPIWRGEVTPIRRKYLEVLARMVESAYEQKQHQIDLERYEMIEQAALAYPFEVIRDDNPKGREWLDHILAEKN